MTRRQKIVAAVTCVLAFGLLLAPLIPAWLFWRRIHQFEQAVGVSDAGYFHEPGDLQSAGTNVGIRYSGNPAIRDALGGTASGLFSDVDAVSISHLNCEKLNALRYVSETRNLILTGPTGSSCPQFQAPPLFRLEVLRLEQTGLDDDALGQLTVGRRLKSLQIINESAISDSGLRLVASNSHLEELFLSAVPAIDGELRNSVELFDTLQTVTLMGGRFGDRAASQLVKIESLLQVVWIRGSLTDEGVDRLARQENLRSLWIVDCPVTDASVDRLIGMQQLEELVLRTGISKAAIERFRAARPDCRVIATGLVVVGAT